MVSDHELYAPIRRRWTVVLASIASFMVGLDVLVTMTALPTLHVELGAGAAGLAWTINAYEIGFAALILTGTALGDRYGRRLLFVVGVAVFTAGSVWCALSSSVEQLIAARAFQGIGGGVATALALAVITAATPPARRGAAFGVWGAVTGIAVAVGPVVGGAIIHGLAWQWIFWLNVPVGVALIGLSLWKIADSRGDVRRVDVVGLALSTVGVVAVAQALIRAGDVGWSAPPTLLGLAGGAVALVAFTVWQHHSRTPMLPLTMFRNRSFSGGCGASFALGAGLYGNAFMFAQYLQLALGHDPLAVGIRLLPWVALAPLISPVAGLLADRIGERPLVITGLGLFAAAFFAIGPLATSGASYTTLILPLFVAGIGVATAFPTIATAVMRSADPTRLGVASGVSNTIRQVGAVFGVAVAVAVFSTFGGYGSPQQFVDGFGPTVTVLAAITLAGLVPAAVIRPQRRRPVRHPREEPMRLREVERGDHLLWRLLIRCISLTSGMRLPDAARIVLYHKQFFGDPMSRWTHMAMRGESGWTVGERELMAAMTANWNACAFCVGAHGAIAARVLGRPVVDTALEDLQRAELPARLRATLAFLEILTRTPDTLTADDARTVLGEKVTPQALEDAIAVAALFNVTGRCADALNYDVPADRDFDRAAKRLLAQGYAFGKGKHPVHADHRGLADAARRRVLEGPGETAAALRQGMAERAAGGPPLEAPYDDLARQIGEAAYKVTDEQVARVVEKVGSERAAFELIVASTLGAGLHRWRRGLKALDEASEPAQSHVPPATTG